MSEKKQKRKNTFLLHSLLMKIVLERKREGGREGEKAKKGRDKHPFIERRQSQKIKMTPASSLRVRSSHTLPGM